jgi:hypothetical protein
LLLLLPLMLYCQSRRLFGLPPATSFRNITTDAALADKLEQLYGGNINTIDAYVGGLAEPHFGNAHVGQLFYASIFDQFRRLPDGDWYYFKNADNGLFNAQEVAEIESSCGAMTDVGFQWSSGHKLRLMYVPSTARSGNIKAHVCQI